MFTRNISSKPMSEDDYTPPPPIVFGNPAGLKQDLLKKSWELLLILPNA